MDRQELIRRAKALNPIDDIMFEQMGHDIEFCQELIQTVIGDSTIKVKQVTPQKALRNTASRSVRLDVWCQTEDGRYMNVEVQKSDNDDHLKRMAYNEASVMTNVTKEGMKFSEIPDVVVNLST